MAQKSTVLFAISESTRIEALEHLVSKEESTISISSDVDSAFKRLQVAEAEDRIIRQRFGIDLPFIMYTGGIDFRKNIEGLIEAFSLLPESVQTSYQLVIVCQISESQTLELMDLAARLKLNGDSLVITGYVEDDDLVLLYNL
jgi:glycosyltransferase involved in cell wall biosynthesis